ncbi:MAG: peptidyl-prolyl cis-trans isomerase A (cyclophilin A) [Myxococcota bacterium]|jgi:peptidyl-prolyl cis-trans isomerase A (cyclophilin A)
MTLFLVASLALGAPSLDRRPIPEAVVLGRAGWQTLPGGMDGLVPGDLLAPVGGGYKVKASGCLEGEATEAAAAAPLVEALGRGVVRPPPIGRSWAEGPVPQTAWSDVMHTQLPRSARLTDACAEVLRALTPAALQGAAVVTGVLQARVADAGCGKMDVVWKPLRGRANPCDDRVGKVEVLAAKAQPADPLLPPAVAGDNAQLAPWPVPEGAAPGLTDPTLATETAPENFVVRFETSQGDIVVRVHRHWAPNGADRFYNLVRLGFYDSAAFFRVIDGFMAQVGISAYPDVTAAWLDARIDDDPVRESNRRGHLSFASAGPDSRTTQVFVNMVDNTQLDGMGFSPFAEVLEGMDVVDALHSGYGEGAPSGEGPDQGRAQSWGGAYLEAAFPELDRIVRVELVD